MSRRLAFAAAALVTGLVPAGSGTAEPHAAADIPLPADCGAARLPAVAADSCKPARKPPAAAKPADTRANAAVAPKIAIIIDDLGYDAVTGQRAIDLPGTVSVAILPGAPHSRRLAAAANARGRDILLHLPMQANGDSAPGERLNLTLDMSRARLVETVEAAFEHVPFAIGLNNHRGSLITRHPGHMQWLMETLAERDSPIFVDSYTTPASVALEIAAETGIDAVKRDVFIDAAPARDAMRAQIERLKRLAAARGAAVAIAHPYPGTLALLESELPRLVAQGFELVAIGELVPNSGPPRRSNPQ